MKPITVLLLETAFDSNVSDVERLCCEVMNIPPPQTHFFWAWMEDGKMMRGFSRRNDLEATDDPHIWRATPEQLATLAATLAEEVRK